MGFSFRHRFHERVTWGKLAAQTEEILTDPNQFSLKSVVIAVLFWTGCLTGRGRLVGGHRQTELVFAHLKHAEFVPDRKLALLTEQLSALPLVRSSQPGQGSCVYIGAERLIGRTIVNWIDFYNCRRNEIFTWRITFIRVCCGEMAIKEPDSARYLSVLIRPVILKLPEML